MLLPPKGKINLQPEEMSFVLHLEWDIHAGHQRTELKMKGTKEVKRLGKSPRIYKVKLALNGSGLSYRSLPSKFQFHTSFWYGVVGPLDTRS